jgi:hypothetical protein
VSRRVRLRAILLDRRGGEAPPYIDDLPDEAGETSGQSQCILALTASAAHMKFALPVLLYYTDPPTHNAEPGTRNSEPLLPLHQQHPKD